MKKTLKALAIATASIMTTGAFAATANMENPLYAPKAGQFFSKTGAGLMYKIADDTDAMKLKHHDGDVEFPVWRFTEDFGYGITDRLNTYLSIGYTKNGDIDRKGMHRGRLGLAYRIFDDTDAVVWDMYTEAYLSGVSPMKGSVKLAPGNKIDFTYDNFSNGRWGAVVGTKVGKTWDKFTASLFAEYLQTFGNHNNKIEVNLPGVEEISVDLKSNDEWLVSANAFYQLDDRWSFGGSLKFIEHADNGVKSIHTALPSALSPLANALVAQTKNMKDGWEEYYITAVLANQVTDSVQLALYGEYVFDTSHPKSQNGTDIKAEIGVRANVRF
jgi:hypothetical protein